jgi:hypothetical protein
MGIYSLQDILFTLKELLTLAEKKREKKDKVTEAIVSIQTAIIETRKFINENGYVPNSDLSKLWLTAFEKTEKAEIYPKNEFPEYLYNKARFWGDPKVWLKEPAAMELVPTLANLEHKADSILVKLR